MASYYYLISSLPTLKTDGGMPFGYDTFLDMCSSSVSKKTYQLLAELDTVNGRGPLLKEWAQVYGGMLKELNYQRKLRLGKQARQPEDRPSGAAAAVSAALAAKNPLEAERVLLAYEFEQLDELVTQHYFDDYVLFGYAIKLKLMERLCSFDHEEGKTEFGNLLDGVRAQVLSL